jgi:hypothetical protein
MNSAFTKLINGERHLRTISYNELCIILSYYPCHFSHMYSMKLQKDLVYTWITTDHIRQSEIWLFYPPRTSKTKILIKSNLFFHSKCFYFFHILFWCVTICDFLGKQSNWICLLSQMENTCIPWMLLKGKFPEWHENLLQLSFLYDS